MAELTCDQTMDEASEYALGILPPSQRAAVATHLLGCQACRREAAVLTEFASALLDVIPGAEPPLGFDRAVLLRVRPSRRRTRTTMAGAVVAAIAMLLLVIGALFELAPGSPHEATPVVLVAVFRQNHVSVGTLTASGRPLWVSVTVHGVALSGPVTCQLVSRGGVAVTLGAFDLVQGSGSWGAYDPAGMVGDGLARIVSRDGQVVATATLR